MKLLILAALFGLSSAICDFTDCHSCAGQIAEQNVAGFGLNGTCYWNLETGQCAFASILLPGNINVVPQALSCPAPYPVFRYTDEFGRYIVLPFSMASNLEGVNSIRKCPAARIPNVQVLKQYTVSCDPLNATCSATMFLHPDASAVIVAFRGSKGIEQADTELFQLLFSNPQPGTLYGGKVFEYFANATDILWNSGLSDDLRAQFKIHPTFQLWSIGHSLGGSLATLAANAAVRTGVITRDRVVVATMGEPRTGDYDFAVDVSTNVPQAYRIIIQQDLVTKMPLRALLQNTNVYHNNFEVWYNNDMSVGSSFLINNRADDYSGSNIINSGSGFPHNFYFAVDMDNYVKNFCF
ncbi:hypothetical protein FO519_006005 [Halicephalobus sp. NKZ332]|nr:hypothetical protein FO519_006005 [Halicephalobus sp. NKZ332]